MLAYLNLRRALIPEATILDVGAHFVCIFMFLSNFCPNIVVADPRKNNIKFISDESFISYKCLQVFSPLNTVRYTID